ncbi:hypothetical protein ElyMa_001459600 [Elysia marginata]|uniref:Secreted protein n=1 Tax=Elysia marginata TaxID=1093978 RepID=A0AAV4IZE3_9GAST|nr:hypothetical protein ElyMa_001459600 [Elysia marginata]
MCCAGVPCLVPFPTAVTSPVGFVTAHAQSSNFLLRPNVKVERYPGRKVRQAGQFKCFQVKRRNHGTSFSCPVTVAMATWDAEKRVKLESGKSETDSAKFLSSGKGEETAIPYRSSHCHLECAKMAIYRYLKTVF